MRSLPGWRSSFQAYKVSCNNYQHLRGLLSCRMVLRTHLQVPLTAQYRRQHRLMPHLIRAVEALLMETQMVHQVTRQEAAVQEAGVDLIVHKEATRT